MLSKIMVHRANARKSIPAWFPIRGIVFDQALVRYVHPDRLDSVYAHLLSTLRPIHNATPSKPTIPTDHQCSIAGA
jgi:hypothetical protein